MKALVDAFNQEKALVGAFSVIVQLHRLIDLRHYLGGVAWLGAARHVEHADHGVGAGLPRLLARRHQTPVPVVVRHRRDREALEGEYILTFWLTEAFGIERHKLLLLLILAHVISTAGIISADLMLYHLHTYIHFVFVLYIEMSMYRKWFNYVADLLETPEGVLVELVALLDEVVVVWLVVVPGADVLLPAEVVGLLVIGTVRAAQTLPVDVLHYVLVGLGLVWLVVF